MKKYAEVIQDRKGNVVPGATILVKTLAGATATIYGANGVAPITNPLTADALGRFSFYAADGRYTLDVSLNGVHYTTVTDILIEDPAEEKVNIAALQSSMNTAQSDIDTLQADVVAAQGAADASQADATQALADAATADGKAVAAQSDATKALADAATADGKAVDAQATADAAVPAADLASSDAGNGAELVGSDDGASGTLWTTIAGFVAKLISEGGASVVGFLQAGVGAIQRSVQDVLREKVSVDDYGADPSGLTDSTEAFNKAMAYLVTKGGGVARMPVGGTYQLKDFVIDHDGILFVGEAPGFTYNQDASGVVIKPGPGAVFSARLKGTRAGAVINASEGSGFKNVVFDDTGYTAEYNVFIDSGLTVLENVTMLGSDYNCVIADQANGNIFKQVSLRKGKHTNFAVTEWQASGYLHPNVTDISEVSNTTIHVEDVNIRQGQGFGAVIRSLVGASGQNVSIESNSQAGLYIYRPDNASVRNIDFDHWWLENNYEAYTSGATTYSIADNRMLWTAANTPIPWNSTQYAGYQLVIDSQTHVGGGCDNLDFMKCTLSSAGTAQKAALILSGFKINFYNPWVTGGDTPNLVSISANAEAVHWHDPMAGNDPAALVTSITDNFGANSGSRGAYYKSGVSGSDLGGVYPIVGVTGGPVHFLAPVASDPRRANPRCLDDYFEGDNSFTVPWRVGSALPFTVNSQTTSVTKTGRIAHIEMTAAITANATTAGAEKLYTGAALPYAAAAAGNLVGRALVQPTGGGASVLNGGLCDMWMDTTASLWGAVDVFPALEVGNSYVIKVHATYTAET